MKVTRSRAYTSFACLAGDCPDTCCVGWEVVLDSASVQRYRVLPGVLGERLRAAMEQTDGEDNFRLNNGRCPFLNEGLLCDIQAALGEAGLCRTCRRFPRFTHDYGAVREEGLSLSCPEAARLIMTGEEGVIFETHEDASLNVEPNDIDAMLYLDLQAMRRELMALAQNRAYSLEERMALCLMMASEAQKRLDAGEAALSACIPFRNEAVTRERLQKSVPKRDRGQSAQAIWARWVEALRRFEVLNPSWLPLLECVPAAQGGGVGPDEEYERLLVYYLYRYFLESVYDGAAYRAVKLAVWSVALIRRLHGTQDKTDQARRVELARLYSREIEHSQDNLDGVYALLGDVNLGGQRWMLKLCRGV